MLQTPLALDPEAEAELDLELWRDGKDGDDDDDDDVFVREEETSPLVAEQRVDVDSSPEWPDEPEPELESEVQMAVFGYDDLHNNPLHKAIMTGSKEGIRAHGRNRKMINEKNAMGQTPAALAAQKNMGALI